MGIALKSKTPVSKLEQQLEADLIRWNEQMITMSLQDEEADEYFRTYRAWRDIVSERLLLDTVIERGIGMERGTEERTVAPRPEHQATVH